MNVFQTELDGVLLIEPNIFGDDRGYFFESYNKSKLDEAVGKSVTFVQDNESRSAYGVLRGFAFQKGDSAQAKLVRVTEGAVLDVVLDLRQSSKTFGQYVMHELSAKNKKQVYIPRGCAHAFLTLSEFATFEYKVDNPFAPNEEGGIIYNDPDLKVEWPIPLKDIKVSEKDLSRPPFKQAYYFD